MTAATTESSNEPRKSSTTSTPRIRRFHNQPLWKSIGFVSLSILLIFCCFATSFAQVSLILANHFITTKMWSSDHTNKCFIFCSNAFFSCTIWTSVQVLQNDLLLTSLVVLCGSVFYCIQLFFAVLCTEIFVKRDCCCWFRFVWRTERCGCLAAFTAAALFSSRRPWVMRHIKTKTLIFSSVYVYFSFFHMMRKIVPALIIFFFSLELSASFGNNYVDCINCVICVKPPLLELIHIIVHIIM